VILEAARHHFMGRQIFFNCIRNISMARGAGTNVLGVR
jgi:hypothetical protein